MPTFPSDSYRGIPASLTKLGSTLFRARYRTNVGDSNAANKVPVIIQLASGQTASALEIYDASKNFLYGVDATGNALANAGNSKLVTTTVSISSADITGSSAGQLGHANGYPLIAAGGATVGIELVSALVSFTYSTAQYGGGGNVTLNISGGGAALTGLISAANSFGAAANKIIQFVPLAAAAQNITSNTGVNLVAASAFTQPGTAAGTIKAFVTYRVHTL